MAAALEHLFAEFRRTGEPAPLGEVFDRTSPQLLAMALHLCAHPADAEDALQATFVTAIDRAAAFDPSRSLMPWLFGILVRRCKQIGERRGRRRETGPPSADRPLDDRPLDEGSPLAESERRELVARLRQHIEDLPAEQRQVLLLQLEHDLSPAEVAEVLGIVPGAVRMRLHRAVKALRGMMPTGLAVMLLGTLHARGLAAVRAAVVHHAHTAGVSAGVAMATSGGAFLMKKVLIGVVLLLLLVVGWTITGPGWWTDAALGTPPVGLAASDPAPPGAMQPAELPESPSLRRVVVEPEPGPTAEAPAVGALSVRVARSDSGLPVPNVPLRVVPDRSDVDPRFAVRTGVTGADGTCLVASVTPGTVRVEAIGGLSATSEVVAGETATVMLAVPDDQAPLLPVRGLVLLPDGRPADGASIVFGPQAGDHAEIIGTADGAGRFELSVTYGFLLLGARLDGYAPSPLRTFQPGDDVELLLPSAGAELCGLVVDALGTPVPGASIVVGTPRGRQQTTAPGGFLLQTAPPQRLVSDDEGRFVVRDLVAGEIRCLVRADGCAPFHCFVTTVAGSAVDVVCRLATGIAVQGRVLDRRGEPVASAYVSLGGSYGETRETDDDGRFGYRHVAPGALQLEVQGVGIERHYCERAADVVGEWLVVVDRLPRYRLRFVDELGQPLIGWRVQLRPVAVPPGSTDASGRLALHVAAGAVPTLWLSPPGGIHAVVPWPLPAGLAIDVENTIVVPRRQQPSGVLLGQVLAPDGRPMADTVIEVRGRDDQYLYRQRDVAGSFRFEGVPAGDWILEVSRRGRGSAGARFPVAALAAGEARDVGELRLPGEGALQIRVVQPDGRLAADAAVFLFDDEGQEHRSPRCDGTPQPWPVGHYRWKVMADEALWQSGELDVRLGAPTALDIVVQPAVRRYLRFPVPVPDWGDPGSVTYVLRAPDGSEYDRDEFDPHDELPFRYMPPLSVGAWQVELTLDDGRRYAGGFTVASLEPSLDVISVAVQPSR